MDGVDAALIATDGEGYIRPLATAFVPYPIACGGSWRRCWASRRLTPIGLGTNSPTITFGRQSG